MTPGARYGSDLAVEQLASLGIEFVALNPGASTRGLHESLVHAGRPEIVLALHEEIAVAAAHGYYKTSGKPMAVLLHDLVGLQHATMAIFNAWVDRTPVLLVGGAGPTDAVRRRPWIDWIHSPRWQSAAVREIVKWDDQPASIPALLDALAQAFQIAVAHPQGPTYVAVDALLQEDVASDEQMRTLPERTPIAAPQGDLERLAQMLLAAEFPVLVADLTGGSATAYRGLVELAETVGAAAVDLGGRHNFPNTHWADLTDDRRWVLGEADLVVCFDVRDTTWALSEIDVETRGARRLVGPRARIVSVGLGDLLPTGFLDREPPGAVGLSILAETSVVLPLLAELTAASPAGSRRERRGEELRRRSAEIRERALESASSDKANGVLTPAVAASELWPLVRERDWLLANGTLSGWARRLWSWDRFGCYLGDSGGAGVGYGAGASVGAALSAQASPGSLVVDLQADGDLLYTPSALWTAAHHRLPLLVVTQNNRTYGKDRLHQTLISQQRNRGSEADVHLGIDIDDPPVDLALLASAQGVEGFGPVRTMSELRPALERALAAVDEGRPALVDVVFDRPS
jgi:benzoylformate decarboxylase/acetolactate synthase-1/2/3 large subunit